VKPILVILVDSLERNNLFYPGTKPPECPREPYEARFQVFPLPRNFGDISGICSPGFFFFSSTYHQQIVKTKKINCHLTCVWAGWRKVGVSEVGMGGGVLGLLKSPNALTSFLSHEFCSLVSA